MDSEIAKYEAYIQLQRDYLDRNSCTISVNIYRQIWQEIVEMEEKVKQMKVSRDASKAVTHSE